MTKAEMIDAVSTASGVSKADAERTLGAFFDFVVTETKKGEKVAWAGFGSFSTTQRAAREGRNPQTGEEIQVAATRACKISVGSKMKAAAKSGGAPAAPSAW